MLNHLSSKQIRSKVVWSQLNWIFYAIALLFFTGIFSWNHREISYFLSENSVNIIFYWIIDFPILYHCAIKKRGTAWITFCIWSGLIVLGVFVTLWANSWLMKLIDPSSFYANITAMLKSKYPKLYSIEPKAYVNAVNFVYLSSFYLCYIQYKYLFALRSRNNLLQYKASLKTEDNRNAYQEISRTTSPAELKLTYKRLKQLRPSLTKFLRFKYRQAKLKFSTQ